MDPFHFGLPDPNPFHETDPDTDPGSQKSAKIKENSCTKSQENHILKKMFNARK